jgi:D-arginine dehydrogenase
MTDFLIIGGGIAGLSAAARLSHLGRVTVLEAEANLAHHTSGRSAAMYEPYYGLAAVVDLSMASGDYFRAIPQLLSQRGMMIWGKSDQAEIMRREAGQFALDSLSVAEAQAIVPILNPEVVKFAAMGAKAWDIDTDLLLQSFVREAKANGADIITARRVSAIRKAGAGWQVEAGGQSYEAAIIINAAGAWADLVAGMAGVKALGLQPMRRSMARIPAPGGHDVSGWPMIFGVGETWYAKPDAGALIVSPAEEHPMEPHDAWADDLVLAEGLARYEEMVTEPVTRLLSNWAGLRTFAPDRVLVIGPDPAEPTFFWLAGQGGYGFQSSAAASQLVADLVAGTPSPLPPATLTALSPRRFA